MKTNINILLDLNIITSMLDICWQQFYIYCTKFLGTEQTSKLKLLPEINNIGNVGKAATFNSCYRTLDSNVNGMKKWENNASFLQRIAISCNKRE